MDRPGLDPIHHDEALAGLARLNRWSQSAPALWPWLVRLARDSGRPVRVLDIACGGGDNIIRLAQYARRTSLAIRFDGCDVSAHALRHVTRSAQTARVDIGTFQMDALDAALPGGYDVLMTSLFLHHLERRAAVDLLYRMRLAANRLVLVNDLVRSRTGLTLAHLACRTLTRSEVVRHDGPQSVRSAFTIAEVRGLAVEAGLRGAEIRRIWPARFLLAAPTEIAAT